MKYFHHTAHKALWNWLSMGDDRTKEAWPGWKQNGGKIQGEVNTSYCMACKYDKYFGNVDSIRCKNCPLVWPYGVTCMDSSNNNLYCKWYNAMENGSFKFGRKLAAQIRDLPVKEGVICK